MTFALVRMDKYLRIDRDPDTQTINVSGDRDVFVGNVKCNAFVQWIWKDNELTLSNDRYGIYPVYYIEDKNSFTVSTSISKLLTFLSNIAFDEDALSVFLRMPWMLGDHTLFEQIKAVPPGSHLTWNRIGFKIRSDGRPSSQALSIKRNEAVAVYAEYFQKAVENTLPASDSIVLPLSGGQDSRHILFELCRIEKRPDCVTAEFPPPLPNEDARIAAILAKKLELSHTLVKQPDERLKIEIIKNQKLGYVSVEHGWFSSMADYIYEKSYGHSYDGIAGDVLSARYPHNKVAHALFRSYKFEELADLLLGKETYGTNFLTEEYSLKLPRERAISFLADELRKHVTQVDPLASFEFWNRTRRTIAPSPLRFLDNINVVMPFLESNVFDFLYSLPVDVCKDGNFHRDTINYAFPQYADIPYAYDSSKIRFDSHSFKNLAKDLLFFSMSSRRSKVIRRTPLNLRCVRALVDKKYRQTVTEFSDESIFLMQLERL